MEKVFTLRLRKILLYDYIYYIFFSLSIIFVLFKINNYSINYDFLNKKEVTGIVKDIFIEEDYISIELESDYLLKANFYTKEDYDISLGDKLLLKGDISLPSENTNFNLFNYRNYLKSEKIYYVMNVTSLEFIESNKSLFYFSKKLISSFIDSNKSSNYIYAFVLGESRYLSSSIKDVYQEIGITHLFSISGMNINLLASVLLFVLRKLKVCEEKRYFFTSIFIIYFMYLVNLSPPIYRSGIFFILLCINNIYYLNIKTFNLLLICVSIMLFSNPYLVYNNGFLYSSIITGALILFSDLINKRKSYLYQTFMTSFISCLFSLPISLNSYFEINFLSILYNLFFVPFVSFVIFPLSLICLFIPVLSNILNILILIMEEIAIFCSSFNTSLIFCKVNLLIIFLYYLIIFFMFYYRKKIIYFIFIILLVVHYNYNSLFKSNYIMMIDVGQGDSFLIHSGNDNVLIDTGGKMFSKNSLSSNILVPLFKSLGIRKIDKLFLSHGDFDHMGDAINLVENFNVQKVIFNNGEYNDLELELIKVLEKKNIPYYQNIKELNVGENKLYFLNNKIYDNENDNSIVLYTKINNHKLLLMGDAGVEVEQDLIEKYNLDDIDILKVGHHGSKTSSSKEFIDYIEPKYSIISVGKNNRYGHPNNEVLGILNDSNIYRTDQDGSIMFKFKKDKLVVSTCSHRKEIE